MYEPFRQAPYWRESLVIRSVTDPRGLIEAVRREVAAPVFDIRTMGQVMYDAHWRPNVYSRLFNLLSAVALILAALGVYGVVSFTTIQRTREFGIRMALGARRGEIVRSAVRQVAVPGGIGLAVGLLLAYGFMRFAASMVYGVESFDPVIAAGTLVAMAGVALSASYVPARRATLIDTHRFPYPITETARYCPFNSSRPQPFFSIHPVHGPLAPGRGLGLPIL